MLAILIWSSCGTNKLPSIRFTDYPKHDYLKLLSSQYDIGTSTIMLQHERNWFESTILVANKAAYQGYNVQAIHYRSEKRFGEINYYDLIFFVFRLSDSVTKQLKLLHKELIASDLVDQNSIPEYNHDWLDCTNDVITIFENNGLDTFAFHCLHQQDTMVSQIRLANQIVEQLNEIVEYKQFSDTLISKLERGRTYNRGGVNIYLMTDEAIADWNASYPKRLYQHNHSDSISSLIETDLNRLWHNNSISYRSRVEDLCLESFKIRYSPTSNEWILLPPVKDVDVDRAYRSCRRSLRRLLRNYVPNYSLIYDETRTVDLYQDSIQVTDSNYYGSFN